MLLRLFPLLATAALAAGCYECNLENCKDGCCSAEGVCIVAPTSDLECGMGGLLCQNCTERPGFRCFQGTCQSQCNAINCEGCCTATGTCTLPQSQSNTSCGERGSICSSCGTNRICQRLIPTAGGECCGSSGFSCFNSYECCSGYSCRPAGNGGLTCQ